MSDQVREAEERLRWRNCVRVKGYAGVVADVRTVLDALSELRADAGIERVCDCAEWEPGIKKINAPIVLQQIRAGQSFPADHFVPWRFCPWCGKAARASEGGAG